MVEQLRKFIHDATGVSAEELGVIQSIEPSQLLYISHHAYYQLLQEIPQWEKFYRAHLEQETRSRLKSNL